MPVDYFVPHYEVRNEIICAVEGRQAKRVSAEQALLPSAETGPGRARMPSAVVDFLNTKADEPQAILRFCNRYGILGVLAWDAFPLPLAPEFRQKVEEAVGRHMLPVSFARHLDASKERPRIADAPPPTDCESAVAQLPLSVTASLWLPEPLPAWRKAQMDFRSCLFLLTSAQVLLLERHGTPAAREEAGPHSVGQLRVMAAALLAAVKGRMPKQIDEWFATWAPDSPPSERLTMAVAAIGYITSTVYSGANLHVRPTEDLTGWEVDADYPCLLNMLYTALFQSFTKGDLPAKCALPGCWMIARPRSQWCTAEHADTHRQRKSRAAKARELSAAEVATMESLVRSEELSHDAAAERIASRRRKRRGPARSPR
jgi:hypothetical protein